MREYVLTNHLVPGQSTSKSRERRYLIFTQDTQMGVLATVSVPLHPETTVSFAWFFEANYYNVANASYFDPLLGDITISRNREERSAAAPIDLLNRSSIYAFIESMLHKHGYPGHPCLLRAICENTTSHFLHNGLLGDLLHLVLTPSASMAEDLEDCYYEAEYLGLENECEYYNHECPVSPIDLISIYAEQLL